ncbi:hypothetical protein B0H63DRAFT_475792 [Podospora didyma]|uniref:Dihydrodipicolinate synthetase n=1 Tax=Podospora didyma TaxID=330526 RepID=A0AAE0NHB3_9PEZI|nr:hypothetical protein B0H63DRAFT_475792 [Podospora didyma]
MSTPPPNVPPSGVWCPAVTLFDPDTDRLIPKDQESYLRYLSSKTGLAGLVILGTNAETFLLTREERKELLTIAREACGPHFPIMAGVGGHSTRQVLEFMDDAALAGANYVLVLPPAYFGAKATTPAVITAFFADVAAAAEKLALGVVVYNFPGVCNGVDIDSATIAALARRYPGVVVGVKLTCGSVAKITRLAAEFPADEFAVFGGQSDFLLGGLAVGSAGCIAAFANAFPRTVVEVYRLYKAGKTAEALRLHQMAALAEQALKNGGISATKYAATFLSADGIIEGAEAKMQPRKPYQPLTVEAKLVIRAALEEIHRTEIHLLLRDKEAAPK